MESSRSSPGQLSRVTSTDPANRRTAVRDALYAFCGPTDGTPRTVIVCAHPDDEVIGAGARMAVLRDFALIHTTNGSPSNLVDAQAAGHATAAAYARARRNELRDALAIAGRPAAPTLCLHFEDQCCARALVSLARALAARITADVQVVLTHAYEGGHPDHDATAFAVHAALALRAREDTPVPALLEMAGYHLHNGNIRTGAFLPAAGVLETTLVLTDAERELKQRMLDAFPTQSRNLTQFGLDREVFRTAPVYDFECPANPEGAYYDRFGWGLSSREWPQLVRDAVQQLGLESATC